MSNERTSDALNPSLAAQIAWVTGLRDEHATDLRRKGEEPGAGLAMIQAVLSSLASKVDAVAAICELDGCQALRPTPPTTSDVEPAERDRAIATILMGAWSEYAALFGTQPHGTFKQLHSMLALQRAGDKIAALFTAAPAPSGAVEMRKANEQCR